ncbi:MAG: glutathione S-transferase N-terminal domain-containing protein [Solirubrobacterales bacterium]|nr:glutathione S-transferase N-terminal domain-containing protein [Solirubrobacterales bacterium]
MSKATLFSLPGSHPAMTVKLMLDFKGIEYRTVDIMPLMHKAAVRALGFPGTTVPALKFNGESLQGSVEIARALDRMVPEPPLLPADEEARKKVLIAEAFGEAELQHAVRQILWNAVRRKPRSIGTFLKGSNLPLPPSVASYTSGPIIWGEYKVNNSTDENARANLSALPGWLDRLDGWVAEGVLDGESLNAADFQIATSIRLACTLQDLKPFIVDRPIGKAAFRACPDYSGDVPPALPAEWLAPLRESASSAAA